MNTIILFTLEIVISISLSTIVVSLLSTPLRNALEDLCPTARQAEFWVAYTRIMLFLAPLMFVMLVDSMTHSRQNLVDDMQVSIIAILSGMILGMLIVGMNVFHPARRESGHAETVVKQACT